MGRYTCSRGIPISNRYSTLPLHLKFGFIIFPVKFVNEWPVTDASDIVFIMLCYQIFVIKLGPDLMMTRQPFKMKRWLVFYNSVRVVDCLLLALKVCTTSQSEFYAFSILLCGTELSKARAKE